MITKYHTDNKKYSKLLLLRELSDFKEEDLVYHEYRSNIPKNYKPSKGELLIEEELIKNKFYFLKEVEFKKCRNPKTNKKLRFDFYLPKLKTCIEFDGIQHFEWVEEFDGQDKNLLKVRQEMDNIKTNFCKNNKILLIRIKYTEINNIRNILKL